MRKWRLMEAVSAAGADGGASGGPAAASPPASVHDRLKSFLTPSADEPSGGIARVESEAASAADEGSEGAPPAREPVPKAEAEDQAEGAGDAEQSGDAQGEEWQPSTLEELAESLGWESDKLLNLPAKVKIDGKDGTASLRDLVKSYQLDGHINQKLASVDTDRKALMADREKFNGERADKLLKLDAGLQTLERSLLQEFQSVDWQKIAAEDPAAYNAKLVAFQQRNAHLQDIAAQVNTEKQQFQAQQMESMKAWLAEQRTLLQAKVPEWADDTARSKDKAEILKYLGNYGITAEEFEAIGDHRHALVVRDAWKWHQLQQSKPAVLNKVRVAPKLLKPGTPQSKAAAASLASNKDRERLKQTGKVSDATKLLKSRLFG